MSIPLRRVPGLLLVGLAVLAALPPAAWSAWPHDPTTNLPVAPVASNQLPNAILPDGSGGVIVAWSDSRGGSYDIYAQRLTASGAVAPGWPATGLLVCNAAGDQFNPVMVSDGAGGAILAWADPRAGAGNHDIYAMRVNADGTLGAGWPANGRLLSLVLAPFDEQNPAIASDGAGGALVVWELVYTPPTDLDIYGAHVTSGGTLDWSAALVTPGGLQQYLGIVPDGAGGGVVCYEDNVSAVFVIRAVGIGPGPGLRWAPITISNAAFDQHFPHEVSDGAGGAIVTWTSTTGTNDVYASRVTSAGTISTGWSSAGNAVAVLAGSQQAPAIASDGNHGAVIAWLDTRYGGQDVFAQRLLGTGAVAPGWPVNGVELVPSLTGNAPAITADGSGGAIVSWPDRRNGLLYGDDLYASRITATGALGPGWTYGGTPISLAALFQYDPHLASDGGGGAIIVWTDRRSNTYEQGYAQRVDLFGQLGNAEPTITGVQDVRGDQGGQVRLVWSASYLDADPLYGIGAYWVWRQSPVAAANAAVARGGAWLDAGLEAFAAQASPEEWTALTDRGLYTTTIVNGVAYAWEFLASQPASALAQYSYVAATTRDSLGGSNPWTPFMVQARATSGPAFWSSAPDSGYSVDNLAPLAPSPFTGTYASGSTALHWGANLEADFAVYRLYRGSTAGFVPGPSSFVVEQPDTGYVDAAGTPAYYKLAAVDVHGNVSGYALLSPAGTLGTPDEGQPRALWLGPATPNPSSGEASFRFTLPRPGMVALRIYDPEGRLVRELVRGNYPAGEQAARWDGRDATGRPAASGLYFVELLADGKALRGRLVSIR